MDDLLELLEEKLGKTFSKSTIQKDIKVMKEDEALGFHAPIGYSRIHDGYYYTDENFTIASIPLNEEEDIGAIDFAATILEQFRGVAIFEQYVNAVEKIMEGVNLSRALEGYEAASIVQFEKVPYQQGSEWLGEIIEAIKARKVLRIIYKRFDADEEKIHEIHPYLLKEYRNRWYVVGMHEQYGFIITLGLDRIIHLEETEIPFRFHLDFDPEAYFSYAFGISTGKGEPQQIVLSFKPLQGQYIKSQPLHDTQEILVDNEEELQIQLTVIPSMELKMQILSYGENVKVLAPGISRKR